MAQIQISNSISNNSIETNVRVAPNDLLISHVLNRQTKKLLQNDIALCELYKQILKDLKISDYNPNVQYNVGDCVWYVDSQENRLYLLRCISTNYSEPNIKYYSNSDYPDKNIDSVLKNSGWENCNKYLTILDYGIAQYLSSYVEQQIIDHQEDQSMHKYGQLNLDEGEPTYIGNSLLKSNLENIDRSRERVFFSF